MHGSVGTVVGRIGTMVRLDFLEVWKHIFVVPFVGACYGGPEVVVKSRATIPASVVDCTAAPEATACCAVEGSVAEVWLGDGLVGPVEVGVVGLEYAEGVLRKWVGCYVWAGFDEGYACLREVLGEEGGESAACCPAAYDDVVEG